MTFPNTQQAYSIASGTSPIRTLLPNTRDPGLYDISYPLYTGWVNTITKAIWYLEALISTDGVVTAQWRAVGPIAVFARAPDVTDYQYPIGQTWVDTDSDSYWALVDVVSNVATWINCGSGSGAGILTLTGNSGGAVGPNGSGNVTLVGSGQISITGNAGSHTLTVALSSADISEVNVDASSAPGTDPVLPTAGGAITVTGAQVAAGTTTNVIRTDSLAANTYTIEIQRSQAVASSTIGDNGVSHFNSADFTVDANGFVSAITGGFTREVGVDAHTGPGTDPVLPTAGGLITVTGGQVAPGTTANVIQTNSLAANTYTVQVQRSQAVASSTVGDNGVCHFNNADFTVDSDGFVSAISAGYTREVGVDAHTAPGTSPVIPTAGGLITVTGGQVAAGTTANVIQTDSLAANTYTIQIQRSQAVASTTVADNGVCHFNSSHFSVDSNGFVSLTAGGPAISSVNIQTFTNSGTYTPTAGMKYCVIEMVGGGGGGGGAYGLDNSAGGGGGSGQYARGVFDSATVGASQAVTVGALGAGGTSGNNDGSSGTASSVGALISAGGGSFGYASGNTSPGIGAGGSGGGGGSGGQIRNTGSAGESGINCSIGATNIAIGGSGGSSFFGGSVAGTASAGSPINGPNAPTTAYGAGGVGGASNNAGAASGGNGAPGIVVITEYIS